MQTSFSPREVFLAKLRFWWLPIAAALLGALLGLVVASFLQPVYESSAELHLAVDFSKIGVVTDIEEDQMIEMVGDVCKSAAVIDPLVAATAVESPEQFWNMASLERRNMQWILRVRHGDAPYAAEITQRWLQTCYDTVVRAHEHALIADRLNDLLIQKTSCLEQSVPQVPSPTGCGNHSIAEIQQQITELASQVNQQQELSFGISPAISFAAASEATPATKPVARGLGWLAFAGAGTGFLAGLWVLSIPTLTRVATSLAKSSEEK